jgi:anaerobic dimethyl sulfoxide reductase subunit B (iron-sulfur subunit)
MAKALLINYEYCTGCHTCEVACQKEHGYPPEKLGCELRKIGPTQVNEKKWQYDFFPVPTVFCDGCGRRVSKGKRPSCVQHCQTGCMVFGDAADIIKEAQGHKNVLFTL